MSTVDLTTAYTLLDLAKATNDQGEIEPLLDIIIREDAFYPKILWQRASNPEYHKFQLATFVADSSLIAVGQGVALDKVTRKWFQEELALFRKRTTIAKDAEIPYGGSVQTMMDDEDQIKLRKVLYDFTNQVINGDLAVDELGFNGLKIRMAALTTRAALQAQTAAANILSPVIGCGGSNTGNMSSVYLLQMATDKTFCIHGKGSKAMGVEIEDMTKDVPVRLTDDAGLPLYGYEHFITLHGGLVVRNPRSVARICNIDLAVDATPIATEKVMRNIYVALAFMTPGQTMALTSPSVLAYLRDFVFSQTNVVTYAENLKPYGHNIVEFAGLTWIPLQQIADTDTTVS